MLLLIALNVTLDSSSIAVSVALAAHLIVLIAITPQYVPAAILDISLLIMFV